MNKELFSWWEANGKLGIMSSWQLYTIQGKPVTNSTGEPYKHQDFRHYIKKWKNQANKIKDVGEINKSEFIQIISKPIIIGDIAKKLNTDVEVVREYIDILEDEDLPILYASDGTVLFNKNALHKSDKKIKPIDSNFNRHIIIGYTSDTHIGCRAANIDALHNAYDWYKEEGVNIVLHTGDLITGEKNYRGQQYDVVAIGVAAQKKLAIEQYPIRNGIDTYIIAGNHEESFFLSDGVLISDDIAKERDDIHCVGGLNETVLINGLKIAMVHPHVRASWRRTHSLPAQNWINELDYDSYNNPDITLMGHFHIALSGIYRGIYYVYGSTMQGRTNLTEKANMRPIIGAWILEIILNKDGSIKEFSPRFRRF